ncbi:hypothetical protein T492DRAFT_1068932 [Pavlovales sp. CCMP2436]|nr:hypothetical protein T492DRAFT_1068932 [Pavlovales sp. CCMP2436]
MSQDRTKAWEPSQMRASSTFGRQAVSERSNAPAFKFGSATRATQARVYLSKEHEKHTSRSDSPGPAGYDPAAALVQTPAYRFPRADRFPSIDLGAQSPGPGQHNVPSGLGIQRSSSNRSLPSYSMGKATREGLGKLHASRAESVSKFGSHSPGPAHNITQPTLGKQSSSRCKTAPSASFSKSERFVHSSTARVGALSAPKAYATPSTFGKQVEGKHVSEPRTAFGTADRQAQSRVYISKEHCVTAVGRDSPGPQAHFSNSHGRQHESTRSAGFSKSDRWGPRVKAELGSPGPGAYSS